MLLFFKFFEISRFWKRVITLLSDALFVFFAYFLSFWLRVGNEDIVRWITYEHVYVLAFTCLVSIAAWIKLGLYRAIIRYIDIKVLSNLALGSIFSTVVLLTSAYMAGAAMPRTIPFIYLTIILILTAGSRLLVRGLIHASSNNQKESVIIYGAGASGRQLCLSLQHDSEYFPVAFVDSNAQLHGTTVANVKVHSPDNLNSLLDGFKVRKVLLAIPSATLRQRKSIIKRVESLKVRMLTIPGSADIISGRVSLSHLRDVEIKDLLGREPVPPEQGIMEKCIQGKSVMVTGAGGSIGSELCRQIVQQNPRILVLLDVSEFNLYQIEAELNKVITSVNIVPILGSVLDDDLLDKVLGKYAIDTIYHAAAYKHVPLVELNCRIGFTNNVLGTKKAVDAALRHNIDYFVLISTDKAVRPTNVMGASKRLAELIVQEAASRTKATTFSMVRFGNVLGSSGSVVPLFKAQIKSGGPVMVTHPEITRYFMTIPEAASLVIQAGAMASGGEVFVLDMGSPIKIRDLAENMIKLMGLGVKSPDNPDGDIEIHYSGLRPGEKLFEELLIGQNVDGTLHPRIMKAQELQLNSEELQQTIQSLCTSLNVGDLAQFRSQLMNARLGYSPVSEIVDLLYRQTTPETEQRAEDNVHKLTVR